MCRLLLVLLALCAVSCSSFERTWNGKGRPVSQRWTGTWKSAANGHSGKLRCAVLGGPASFDGKRGFLYHATWGKLLSGTFEIWCAFEPAGRESWNVRGEKDLGAIFGGVFAHEGQIRGNSFHAAYRSKLDHGTFDLTRAD